MAETSLVRGKDGLLRCAWIQREPEDLLWYHDEEWGTPSHDSRHVFETFTLGIFAAGIRYTSVLRKRDAFRAAFKNFDASAVADMDGSDVERLMGDATIIRNRRKIEATIWNARIVRDGGDFAELIWSFGPQEQVGPSELDTPATSSADSDALTAELKQRGFKFVGTVSLYATMEALGLYNHHVPGCFRSAQPA